MTDRVEGRAAPRIANGWIPRGETQILVVHDTEGLPYIREDALPELPAGFRDRMEANVTSVLVEGYSQWFWSLVGIARLPGAADLEWERGYVREFVEEIAELVDMEGGPIPGAEENPA